MSLIKLEGTPIYKPTTGFKYQWAYDLWEQHDSMVWHKTEYSLSQDTQDYTKASKEEKEFITNVMKLFTENDVMASTGYSTMLRIFKPFEVYGMLSSFNDREITHVHNYANFTETIGLSNAIYSEFLEIPVMSSKTEYLEKAKVRKYEYYKSVGMTDAQVDKEFRRAIARMLAVYAGGLEGTQLFAQFAMLMLFQKQGKYPGLVDIVLWSIKDEYMHLKGNAQLFRTFIEENPDIWDDALKFDIYQAMREIVSYEHELIDYLNPPHAPNEMFKRYIEYMADNALSELGMKKNWDTPVNPIPFMDDITGTVVTDFFSGNVTEYSKTVQGDWGNIDYTKWTTNSDTCENAQ